MLDGEAIHGAYHEEGTQRHFDCHVERYGEPLSSAKKLREEFDEIMGRARKHLRDLRRATRRSDDG
jgi:hypothetical protein